MWQSTCTRHLLQTNNFALNYIYNMDLSNATFNNWGNGKQVIAETYYENGRKATTAENLHTALETMKDLIENKRQWFSVIKVLMWRGYVCEGDFAGAVAMIQEVIPGLMLDAKDMSRLNVQSFTKPLERWDVSDAPVQGNVYMQYKSIASKGMEIIPEKKR